MDRIALTTRAAPLRGPSEPLELKKMKNTTAQNGNDREYAVGGLFAQQTTGAGRGVMTDPMRVLMDGAMITTSNDQTRTKQNHQDRRQRHLCFPAAAA